MRALPIVTPTQSTEHPANLLWACLDLVRRRKGTILTALGLTLGVVLWGIMQAQPVYEAMATLYIEETGPQIVSAHEAFLQNVSRLTEVEMLQDQVVLEQVIALLRTQQHLSLEDYQTPGLIGPWLKSATTYVRHVFVTVFPRLQGAPASPPDPEALARHTLCLAWQDALRVKPREGTKLVDVTLAGYNPQAITRHLQTLIQVYMQRTLEKKLTETKKILTWLQSEEQALKTKMAASTAALKQMREEKKLFELTHDQPKITIQTLSDVNAAYLQVKRERVSLQQHIDTLAKASATEVVNLPIVAQNEAMKTLKHRYLEVTAQIDSLSGQYLDKHPKIVSLRKQLHEVHAMMLRSVQQDYKTLQEKEAALAREVALQQDRILDYKNDTEAYGDLTSAFDVNKNIYLDILKKIQEFSLIEASAANNVQLVRQATVPLYPVPSGHSFRLLAGLVIGLGLGVAGAVLRDYVDPSFTRLEDVEAVLHIPFLGVIPHFSRQLLTSGEQHAACEAYQTLRARVQQMLPAPVKTLLVTSAVAGEGKSTTAAHLGLAFAQLGQRVLLVDVDLRRPAVHRYFQLTQTPGITDVLSGSAAWRYVTQSTFQTPLYVLSAGTITATASQLLYTQQMHTLIEQVRNAYDVVIFDAPIALGIPDVEILAPLMDGVLLVHRPVHSTKEMTLEATTLLVRARATLLGVVFNGVNLKQQKYYRLAPQTSGYQSATVRKGQTL